MQAKTVLTSIAIAGTLLLVGLAIAPAQSSSLPTPPLRTWFFHNYYSNKGWIYTMNESSPQLGTNHPNEGLGFFYFEPKAGNSLYDQTRTGYNVTFTLSPTYPYGFELIPGTSSIELWMQGQGGNSFPSPNLSADFNLALSGPTGQIMGTTLTTVTLPVTNPPRAWNHT